MKKIAILSLSLMLAFTACGGSSGSSSDDDGGGGGSTTCKNYTTTATCSNAWAELSPTGTAPAVRYFPGVAYDAADDALIAFGGTDGTTYYNDVFVLSNASGRSASSWSQLSPTGTAPATRRSAVVAYNSASNKLIVFGGGTVSAINMDLFILSNANGSGTPAWTNPAISGTAPSSRTVWASAYDEAHDTLILFGGRICTGSSCTLYNDVYLITSASTAPTWQQLSPTGTLPDKLVYASGVYDPTGNRFIVFGGNTSTSSSASASSAQSDTWVLSNADGTGGTPAWTQLSSTASIGARFAQSAVYDEVGDRMIVFGGISSSNVALDDTWVLIDSRGASPRWAQYPTCAPVPDARGYHPAAYTGSTLNRMIIFAGMIAGGSSMNDVWVLSDANGESGTAVSSVTVTSETTEICSDYTLQLVPDAFDSSGNAIGNFLYSCTSSNTSIATVDGECKVTAVAAGTVIITVWINGVEKQITLTIVSTGSGGGGGTVTETWTGTYDIQDYSEVIFWCTYRTTGTITMSITKDGSSLDGTTKCTNYTDTIVEAEDPTMCVPLAHLSQGTLQGSVDANGNYAFTWFDIDLAGQVAPFTATVSGNSMQGDFSRQVSNYGVTDTYTGSISATKQ